MRKLSGTEIKKIEFELLKVFCKLCEANNIYYVLCGGTLLGAIRHKGFIPWDDDIDVLVPRPDYERLLKVDELDLSMLPPHIRLVSWKNGEFDYPYIKLVDTRTRVEIPYFNDEVKSSHLWIDVFTIDGNPEDEKKLKKLYKRSIFYRQLLRLKTARAGEGKTKFRKLVKPLLILMVSGFSIEKLCKKIDDIAKTYDFDECEYIGGVLWGYGPQERVHKAGFMKPVQVEFEGEMFNAPSNYDEYLTGLYKDYMQLPPEDKRVTHDMDAFMDGE